MCRPRQVLHGAWCAGLKYDHGHVWSHFPRRPRPVHAVCLVSADTRHGHFQALACPHRAPRTTKFTVAAPQPKGGHGGTRTGKRHRTRCTRPGVNPSMWLTRPAVWHELSGIGSQAPSDACSYERSGGLSAGGGAAAPPNNRPCDGRKCTTRSGRFEDKKYSCSTLPRSQNLASLFTLSTAVPGPATFTLSGRLLRPASSLQLRFAGSWTAMMTLSSLFLVTPDMVGDF